MPEKVLERNRKSRRSMKLGARWDEWTKLDTSLRLFIYRHLIAKCRAPSIAEMAKRFKSRKHVDAALLRLCASHAFVLQENRESFLLWQLHLGRTRHPCNAPQRRPDRCLLRLLQFGNVAEGREWPAAGARGTNSYSRSCPRLVQGHCLYLKDHASVPVGTACRSLVQTVESASGWRPGLAARLPPGEGMVQ